MSKDLSGLNDISIELEIEINYEPETLPDNNGFNPFHQPSLSSANSKIHYGNAKNKPDIETCSNTIPIAIAGESTSKNKKIRSNWYNYVKIIQKGPPYLYQCKTCLKTFTNRANFAYHKFCGRRDDNPFKCVFCEKEFIAKDPYYYHISAHIGERPWQCYVCGQDYINKGSLARHSLTHQERTLGCLICSKKFYHKSSLYNHQKVHSNYRPFLCKYCGNGFPTNNHLLRHINSLEAGCQNCKGQSKKITESNSLFCEHCDRTFSIKQDLDRHIISVHSTERTFNGEQCEMSFNRKDILYQHMSSKHSDRKQYHAPTNALRRPRSSSISEVALKTDNCAQLTSVDCQRQGRVTIDNSEACKNDPHTNSTLPTGNISNDTAGIGSFTQNTVVLTTVQPEALYMYLF